jgi:galactokinase
VLIDFRALRSADAEHRVITRDLSARADSAIDPQAGISRVPLHLGEHRLVTLDSGERRDNAGSGYNRRREECAEACSLLGVETLRDATLDGVEQRLPERLARRARHVISENERVLASVAAIEAGDIAGLGRLLNASHTSLRDDYEVSTDAVEQTVARLRDAGAVGARMIGGGFGGHVLGLLPARVVTPPGASEVAPGEGAALVG